MTSASRFRCLLLILPLLALTVSSADAQRRGRSNRGAAMAKAMREQTIKAAQAQYAQAESLLSIAMSNGSGAEGRLSAVIAEMQHSANEFRQARSQEIDLKKELAEIEADILKEQKSESDYVRFQTELQDKKGQLARLESKLLGTTEFAAKKATLLKSTEGPAAVAAYRKETLDHDSEYTTLKLRVEELNVTLGKLKRELFTNDSEWKETHDAMVEAHKDVDEANGEVYKKAPDRMDPLRDIKSAKQAAAAARTVMAQAEAVLKQYNAPTKPATKPSTTKK